MLTHGIKLKNKSHLKISISYIIIAMSDVSEGGTLSGGNGVSSKQLEDLKFILRLVENLVADKDNLQNEFNKLEAANYALQRGISRLQRKVGNLNRADRELEEQTNVIKRRLGKLEDVNSKIEKRINPLLDSLESVIDGATERRCSGSEKEDYGYETRRLECKSRSEEESASCLREENQSLKEKVDSLSRENCWLKEQLASCIGQGGVGAKTPAA